MTVFAHLSDLHATPPRWTHPAELTPKRLLGRLSWELRRRHEHRPEVLDALVDDLASTRPDHVAITGDVTNQGLTHELEEGRAWLARLGGPRRVFLVPGNHDVYVRGSRAAVARAWQPYLSSDGDSDADAIPSSDGDSDADAIPGSALDPPVRRVGSLALVGACSVLPTPTGFANGRIGPRGRLRLERTLRRLGAEGCVRVLLLHHPPWLRGISRRRGLDDARALRDVLRRAGAELVLHGHVHRAVFESLPGPAGDVPVVGVASASALGRRGEARRGRYHLLEPLDEGGFALRARVLDPAQGCFVEGEARKLG